MSCNLSGLASDGIDAAEDSGFDLTVKNFSDTEYNNCIFYMGYEDSNDKFIASDSLVFKNIVIYKKGDGNNFNSEYGSSSTNLFNRFTGGLNKYGMWEPNSEVTSKYFKNGEIFFR